MEARSEQNAGEKYLPFLKPFLSKAVSYARFGEHKASDEVVRSFFEAHVRSHGLATGGFPPIHDDIAAALVGAVIRAQELNVSDDVLRAALEEELAVPVSRETDHAIMQMQTYVRTHTDSERESTK